ncbi:hypothetical protein [Dietzia cinnamea]|nr:hypothetical protein [Dietzia cinnamea]MCT2077506.1 hypothetical protein [Dietzia cinnamea]
MIDNEVHEAGSKVDVSEKRAAELKKAGLVGSPEATEAKEPQEDVVAMAEAKAKEIVAKAEADAKATGEAANELAEKTVADAEAKAKEIVAKAEADAKALVDNAKKQTDQK